MHLKFSTECSAPCQHRSRNRTSCLLPFFLEWVNMNHIPSHWLTYVCNVASLSLWAQHSQEYPAERPSIACFCIGKKCGMENTISTTEAQTEEELFTPEESSSQPASCYSHPLQKKKNKQNVRRLIKRQYSVLEMGLRKGISLLHIYAGEEQGVNDKNCKVNPLVVCAYSPVLDQ